MEKTLDDLLAEMDETDRREGLVDALLELAGEVAYDDPDGTAKWARQTVYDLARKNGRAMDEAGAIAERVSGRVLSEVKRRRWLRK